MPSCPSPTTPSTEHMHLHILPAPQNCCRVRSQQLPPPAGSSLQPRSAGSAVALALEARREVAHGLVLLRGDQVDDGRQHGRVPAPHGVPVHGVRVFDLLLEKIIEFLSQFLGRKAKRGAQLELQHQRGSSALGPVLLPFSCSPPSSSFPQGCFQDQTLPLNTQSLWWDSHLWMWCL